MTIYSWGKFPWHTSYHVIKNGRAMCRGSITEDSRMIYMEHTEDLSLRCANCLREIEKERGREV